MLTTTATTKATAAATTITTMTTTATTMMTTVASVATRNSRSSSSSSSSSSGSVSREITDTMTTTPTTTITRTKTMTTITSDPGILCFHHCNVKVFCFTLPHICPQCKTALATYPSSGGAGDTSSGTGTKTGAAQRRKNKKISVKNKQQSSAAVENSRHSIDSNKDDNANNHQHQHQHQQYKDNSSSHNDSDTNDEHDDDGDDDDDDDDEDDLNRNTLTSHLMANSRLLPFRLPYPFVRANQYPCAIVLRPTTGDFLNDYNNTTDLHIAVTTSTGCVVEFDRHGLRRHRTDNMSEWWQCLLVGDVPEPWYDYWDQVLFEICQQPDMWTVSHYHEDKHNCYTFVLTFLQALTYDKLSEAATSKTRFCEKYIVPRTTTAGKYISLYRKLRDAGIYVHHTNHHKVRYVRHQQQQQHQNQQSDPNKSNNLTKKTATTTTTSTMAKTKNSWLAANNNKQYTQQQQKQQQQHLSNHHNHQSIISRPHSTLCTIEE